MCDRCSLPCFLASDDLGELGMHAEHIGTLADLLLAAGNWGQNDSTPRVLYVLSDLARALALNLGNLDNARRGQA
ncbi:MAG: hypothetical protein KDK12_17985 [Rhodobacteraceae bacterium]|nr:hypothetical protein [Paracoccaceae bacterium]